MGLLATPKLVDFTAGFGASRGTALQEQEDPEHGRHERVVAQHEMQPNRRPKAFRHESFRCNTQCQVHLICTTSRDVLHDRIRHCVSSMSHHATINLPRISSGMQHSFGCNTHSFGSNTNPSDLTHPGKSCSTDLLYRDPRFGFSTGKVCT